MSVLMGLLAALLWGATDFLVGINAKHVGVKKAVFFSQAFGFLLMSTLILMSTEQWKTLASAPASTVVLGIIASLFTLIGALALSKAFEIGRTAIVAPLVTMYGVFTTLLAWIGGEKLSTWQLLGILICVLGVLLASSRNTTDAHDYIKNKATVLYSLSAALLYGVSFWIQGQFTLPILGPINMLALGYTIGVIALAPTALKFSHEYRDTKPLLILSLLGASLFNLGAFYAFSWGAINGSISVVTVISTLSGAIAGFFGFIFFHERLRPLQIIGVGFVLIGAMTIHSFE